MSLALPEIESDLELWLSVLADNELDSGQRSRLVQHLESRPENWRACAIVLMDQQLIGSQLFHCGAPEQSSHIEPSWRDFNALTSRVIRRQVNWRRVLVGAVAVVASIGLLLFGAWKVRTGFEQERQAWTLTGEAKDQQIARLSQRLTVESLFGPSQSLAGLYPDKPMLIEIENTSDRTLYLTDRPVSDAMLESFAAAGQIVDVNPYQPRLMTSRMRSLTNPILAVEVYKFNPVLLVQGVSQ